MINMSKLTDLTGNVYGKLIVIKRVENRYGNPCWLCKCRCGNEKSIQGSALRNGLTKTCGKCSNNTWEFKVDYVIGYTTKRQKFYIDTEDYKKISKYSWYMDKDGYIATKINGKTTFLHRFIMNAQKGEYVDHINHRPEDNRKSVLRICTNQENVRNSKNTKGYYWHKQRNKYCARITVNGKSISLGLYKTEDEARLAYCIKALELFGEFVHTDVIKDYERLFKN
jgi:hypothetical protein